jgi:arylsulfatase A-like enzyme
VHRRTQISRQRLGVAESVTDRKRVVLPSYYPDLPAVRADLARHYDNIHQMDQHVGRILAELQADGLLSNTIVIWTTDHGDGLPRAKRELYDSGLRVPMLLRFPDRWGGLRREGAIEERLVSFVDLAPTILSLARVDVPDYMHGVNFLDVERNYVFASRDRIDEVPDRQRAVRDGRFKYIRSWYPKTPGGHVLAYRDNLDMVRAMRAAYLAGELNAVQDRWFEAPGREQLYDTVADPEEVANLIDDPALQGERQRLAGVLDRWLERVGDTSAQPEPELRAALLADGRIPVTPNPRQRWEGRRLHLFADDGASIGYRIDGKPWQLYSGSFLVKPGAVLEAKAVRYGWRESAIVEVSVP